MSPATLNVLDGSFQLSFVVCSSNGKKFTACQTSDGKVKDDAAAVQARARAIFRRNRNAFNTI